MAASARPSATRIATNSLVPIARAVLGPRTTRRTSRPTPTSPWQYSTQVVQTQAIG